MPELERLLGQRFVTDFTVVGFGESPTSDTEHPARPVKLRMRVTGELCTISLSELRAVIASGFIWED